MQDDARCGPGRHQPAPARLPKHLVHRPSLVLLFLLLLLASLPQRALGFDRSAYRDLLIRPDILINQNNFDYTMGPGKKQSMRATLATQPTSNVKIAITSTDTNMVTINRNTMTFTTSNWNLAQTVSCTAQQSSYDDPDARHTSIEFSITGSTDVNYCNVDDVYGTVTHSFTYDDTVLRVMQDSLASSMLEAGGTAEFTVSLSQQPDDLENVTVSITIPDTDRITTTNTTLVFTNVTYNVEQTVTVTAIDNDVVEPGGIGVAVYVEPIASGDSTYDGTKGGNVFFLAVDDDTAGIVQTPTPAAPRFLGDENNGTAQLVQTQFALLSKPRADVVITVAFVDDDTEATTNNSLTVTMLPSAWTADTTVGFWFEPKTDNNYLDGTQTVTATYTVASADPVYNGLTIASEQFMVDDADVPNITASPTTIPSLVEAGANVSFTVTIGPFCDEDVAIHVYVDSARVQFVGDTSHTFAAPFSYQDNVTFTMVAVNDMIEQASDENVTVTVVTTSNNTRYNALANATVVITTVDNEDRHGISVVEPVWANWTNLSEYGTPGVLPPEGDFANDFEEVTVVLASEPTSDVTLDVASNNTDYGTVDPEKLVFTADNYTTPQTVRITAVRDEPSTAAANYFTVTIVMNSSGDTFYNTSNLSWSRDFTLVGDDLCDYVNMGNDVGEATEDAVGVFSRNVQLLTAPEASEGVSGDLTLIDHVTNDTAEFIKSRFSNAFDISWPSNNDVDAATRTYRQRAFIKASGDLWQHGGKNDVPLVGCWTTIGDVIENEDGVIQTVAAEHDVVLRESSCSISILLGERPIEPATITVTTDVVNFTATPAELVYTKDDYNTSQTVVLTGLDDLNYTNSSTNVTVTMTGSGVYANAPPIVRVYVIIDDEAPMTLDVANAVVSEAGTTSEVVLTLLREPTHNVTVVPVVNVTTEGDVSNAANTLTFGVATWNVSQTFTVTGVDDNFDDGDQQFEVTLAITSNDTAYDTMLTPGGPIVFTNTDNDTAFIAISPATVTLGEATTDQQVFSFQLATEPDEDVTASVALQSGMEYQATLNVSELTFLKASWDTPQVLTVDAVDDDQDDGTVNVVLSVTSVSSSNSDAEYVDRFNLWKATANETLVPSLQTAVTITFDDDNDETGLVINNASIVPIEECGTTTNFTVRLRTKPLYGSDVVVVLKTDPEQATLSTATLTFGPGTWYTDQTVTATGVNDHYDDVDFPFAVNMTWSSAGDAQYNVSTDMESMPMQSTNDNDLAGIHVDPRRLTIDERPQHETFTVVLTTKPRQNVTVSVVSGDTTEGTVTPDVLTFKPEAWNVKQTVTVSSVNDFTSVEAGDSDVDFQITLTTTSSGDPLYNNISDVDVDVTSINRETTYETRYYPTEFYEGQEFRVELKTWWIAPNGARQAVRYFDVTHANTLEIRTYVYNATHDADCAAYAAGATPLASRTEWGLTEADAFAGNVRTHRAFATIPAAPADNPWMVCYRHTMPQEPYFIHSPRQGEWQALQTIGGSTNFTSKLSKIAYVIPEATVGQYAIVQILGDGLRSWQFTFGPSGCAAGDHMSANNGCIWGDAMKIVPKGEPCTYEYWGLNQAYYGVQRSTEEEDHPEVQGRWKADAAVLESLLEGATAGGVGALGSQLGNPLVDEWLGFRKDAGSYNLDFSFPDNTAAIHVPPPGGEFRLQQAYSYVRLPQTIGEYDVCYSPFYHRRDLQVVSSAGGFPYDVPVWLKVRRCTTPEACWTEENRWGPLTFETEPEVVGWSMADTTPLTWGDIVFDDSGEGMLNTRGNRNYTSVNPVAQAPSLLDPRGQLGPYKNYWAPEGGDMFKLIRADRIGEARSAGSRASHATLAGLGSFATSGCWSRDHDDIGILNGLEGAGGFNDGSTPMPLGSLDLYDSPLVDPASRADDRNGTNHAYASFFLPQEQTEWYVCYRRTCNFDASANATCKPYTGMRVLPMHTRALGSAPSMWMYLEDFYTESHKLIPSRWWEPGFTTPLLVTWYVNTGVEGAYAPVLVERRERSNAVEPRTMDTIAWDLRRAYTNTSEHVMETVGAALRLVPGTASCDYQDFWSDVASGVATEATKGGKVECDSLDAYTDLDLCAGSSTTLRNATSTAFYIVFPLANSTYAVCFREGGGNWRKLDATLPYAEFTDPFSPQPSSVYERDGVWFPPENNLLSVDIATVTLDYFPERRSGFEAVLLLTDSASDLTGKARGTCPGGCSNSGDVVRVVPEDVTCEINPTNWDDQYTDTRLGLTCTRPGAGSLNQSGVLCAANNTNLGSKPLYAFENVWLEGWVKNSPDVFDDIIPEIQDFKNRQTITAGIVLPDVVSNVTAYKVCYKQAQKFHWYFWGITLESFTPYAVDPAPKIDTFVAGEYREFVIAAQALPANDSDIVFHAKMVRYDESAGAALRNKACQVAPPASTEGEIGASSVAQVFERVGAASVKFGLQVPHEPGVYSLCFQVVDAALNGTDAGAWWRPGATSRTWDYRVVDNGVRWYVNEGFQPTNNALTVVNLLRCKPLADGSCAQDLNEEVFFTDPGDDGAKLVDADAPCKEGASSLHVGVGGSTAGVSDLGPADGPTDVAEMRVNLPFTPSDAPTRYKVCAWTVVSHPDVPKTRLWFEIRQGFGVPGQKVVINPLTSLSGFSTQPAVVRRWVLDEGIRPMTSLYNADQRSTALAGAATRTVANATAAADAASGTVEHNVAFKFETFLNVPSIMKTGTNHFKLVLAKAPNTRTPQNPFNPGQWGDVSTWESLGADCLSPPADSASNLASCSDPDATPGTADCPHVPLITSSTPSTTVDAVFHIPIEPGAYLVCFKLVHPALNEAQPWLSVPSVGGGGFLYSHPAFLDMSVTTPPSSTQGGGDMNVSVFDTRTVTTAAGQLLPASTWCADAAGQTEGVPCAGQAFEYDLLTVANGSQVCPSPTAAPSGSAKGPPQWFEMKRDTNTSMTLQRTWGFNAQNRFVLPPLQPTKSGNYKICVYKAGSPGAINGEVGRAAVVRAGVVYQLYNRGDATIGGGSGYWRQNVGGGYLSVTTQLQYDATRRFAAYSDDLQARYGAVPLSNITDSGTGQVSRTPLLKAGITVDYVVQITSASGDLVPYGSYLIDVLRCPAVGMTWTLLECAGSLVEPSVTPGPFVVETIGGDCSMRDGPKYGWVGNGLQQYTQGGFVTFSLQYKSACPGDHFGCGVRFRGRDAGAGAVGGDLWSTAQWVNIKRHSPDAVSIDSRLIATDIASPPRGNQSIAGCGDGGGGYAGGVLPCYMRTCVSGEPCVIAIQARYLGPDEFAPKGTVAMAFSREDYFGEAIDASAPVPDDVFNDFGDSFGSSAVLIPAQPWDVGGRLGFSTIPRLAHDVAEGYAFFNLTYGEGLSSRFVIRVTRLALGRIQVSEIRPLDVELGYTTQMSRAAVPATPLTPTVTGATVVPGTYLEALMPYEFTFEAQNVAREPLPARSGFLGDWVLRAVVLGANNEASVLAVRADAAENLTPAPQLLGPTFVRTFLNSDVYVAARCRVYVMTNVCSRFQLGGGCTIEFSMILEDGISTKRFLQRVVTPIRVPASTIVAVAADGANLATATRTVREGWRLRAIPGTWVVNTSGNRTFVHDEYHYGDIFALIDGDLPTNGASDGNGLELLVPDGARCAYFGLDGGCVVEKSPARLLEDTRTNTESWGAEWVIRPSKPCYKCPFTFHSTWGAGPETHGNVNDTTGILTLTWTDEQVVLDCSAAGDVVFDAGLGRSAEFDVRVSALAAIGRDSAVYPDWWVFADLTGNATFEHFGGADSNAAMDYQLVVAADRVNNASTPTTMLRSRMGAGSVAVFDGLQITGTVPPEPNTAEVFRLHFKTIALEYASTTPGSSRPTSQKEMTCFSVINLVREGAVVGEGASQVTYRSGARLAAVNSVRSLCSGDVGVAGCSDWEATDVDLHGDSKFIGWTVEFLNVSSTGRATVDATTQRYLTIIPRAGATTVPKNVPPSWSLDTQTGLSRSNDIRLDSAFNLNFQGDVQGRYIYTHGTAEVLAYRTPVENGRATMSLRYGKASGVAVEAYPVRKAVFDLCESFEDAGNGRVSQDDACFTINLWITPLNQERHTTVWSEADGGAIVHGTGGECGGAPLEVEVMSYYTSSSVTSITTRFYMYDLAVEYRLRLSDSLVEQSLQGVDTRVHTESITERLDMADKTHTLSTDDLKVKFAFYGVYPTASPTALQITPTPIRTAGVTVRGIETTGKYRWVKPPDTIGYWSLSSTVAYDNECPTKRRLMTSTLNYRTFAPVGSMPGAGWGYEDSVAVDVPFPLETVVRVPTAAAGVDTRAKSFTTGTLMRVSKRSWRGCNDGGALRVYALAASTPADAQLLLPGTLSDSFTLTDGAVPTRQGVGVAWPLLTAECESCTLQVELCYTQADTATCLDSQHGGASNDPSDKFPLFADRIKLTRPFSVRKPKTELVQVVEQRLPVDVDGAVTDAVSVGDMFGVELENVQIFGGQWAMKEPENHAYTREVWVRSVWQPASVYGTYSNGGFLHDGGARAARGSVPAGCAAALSAAEYTAASQREPLATSGGIAGDVTFFFARPCDNCEIWIDYRLTPPAGTSYASYPVVEGSFPLRSYNDSRYPDAPLLYTVTTCGKQWLLAGRPTPAVRKRMPFSLTVLYADVHNTPSFKGTANALFQRLEGHGNGGGGQHLVTSPMHPINGVKANDGSATVRVSFTRACYDCSVMFGERAHHFTVLADATRVVAMPLDIEADRIKYFTFPGQLATWRFEVYYADEHGDRAFTVGGPSIYAFHPHYAMRYNGGFRAGQSLKAFGSVPAVPSLAYNNATLGLSALRYGSADLQATQGRTIFNGLPVESLGSFKVGTPPGVVELTLDGPAAEQSLGFTASGVGILPTYLPGSARTPKIAFSVNPTRLLVAGATNATKTCEAGTACTVTFFAIGQHPQAVAVGEPGTWYLTSWSSTAAAPVRVSLDCGECRSARITPTGPRVVEGRMDVDVTAELSADLPRCDCTVTAVPPASVRGRGEDVIPAVARVSLVQRVATQWVYASTPLLTIAGNPAGGSMSAESIADRAVSLRFEARAADGTSTGLSPIAWDDDTITLGAVGLAPADCFQCDGSVQGCRARISDDGRRVEITGVFSAAGGCTFGVEAFSGFATAAGAVAVGGEGLSVAVRVPAAIELVEVPSPAAYAALSTPVGRLYGRTADGHPAGICGIGVTLSVRVVTDTGAFVAGDNHMKFTLVGANELGETWSDDDVEITARNGVGTFILDSLDTTRSLGCTNPINGTCRHIPWTFNVTARAQLLSSRDKEYGTIAEVGPVYFVRRAARLVAFAKLELPCVGVACESPDVDATEIDELVVDHRNRGFVPVGFGSRAGEHGGRVSPALPHPANTMVGKRIDSLEVFAIDPTGAVVDDPEDLGSQATITFNPVAIPCRAVEGGREGRWLRDSCIVGGLCQISSIPALPRCDVTTASGWKLPSQTFQLRNGHASLAGVTYGPEGLGTRPGLARFLLDTSDMDHSLNAGVDDPADTVFFSNALDSFLCEVNVQTVVRLLPVSATAVCEAAEDPVQRRCTMPEVIEPLTLASFRFEVADEFDMRVRADSSSNITVHGQCLSDPAEGGLLAYSNAGVLDFVTLPRFPVVNGVAEIHNITFTNRCHRMRLTFTCDSDHRCHGKTTEVEVKVAFKDDENRTVSTDLGSTDLRVGCFVVGGANTQEDVNQQMDFITPDDFEGGLLALTRSLPGVGATAVSATLEWLCTVPDDLCLTDNDKLNASRCFDATATPVPPTPEPTPAPFNRSLLDSREAEVLEINGKLQAQAYVTTRVAVDEIVAGQALTAAILADLVSPTSILKEYPAFADAEPSLKFLPETTPAPPTPAPPPATPAPPTPEPPLTPIPPTQVPDWGNLTEAPATSAPVMTFEPEVTGEGAGEVGLRALTVVLAWVVVCVFGFGV